MRQVLSVSLPPTVVRQIRWIAKKRGHASVSQYLHALVHADQDIISEVELLKSVHESQKEYQRGKSIRVASIADLV